MSSPTIELIKLEEVTPESEVAIKNEALLDEKLGIVDDLDETSKCGEIFALHSGNFILICGFCGVKFENMPQFGEHIREKHLDCILQPEMYRVAEQSDPISIYAPIIEKTEFNIPDDEFSTDESQYEEESSRMSSSESEEDVDCTVKPTRKAFSCSICSRSYGSKRSLRRHQQLGCKPEPAGDPELFCRICNKQLRTRKSFNGHQQLKHGGDGSADGEEPPKDPSLFCELCNKYFKSKYNFYQHGNNHHTTVLPIALRNDTNFLKCKFCEQQCTDASEKVQHESTHGGDRPYICSYCKQTFTSITNRNRHSRIHTAPGERPYGCSICSKSFSQKLYLSRHLKRHSDTADLKCEVCGKAFTRQHSLTLHMRRHTGNRMFVCEDCGATYTVLSELNHHRKRHMTPPKDFQCDICQKPFYSLPALKDHQIGHTNEQPFVCDVCGRRFSRFKAHKKHMKLHSGVKEYVCNICGKAYAQDSGLYAHKKSHFK